MRFLHTLLLLLCSFTFSAAAAAAAASAAAAAAAASASSQGTLPPPKCLHNQRFALVQLKQNVINNSSPSVSFDENSSMRVQKWDLKTDCCTWEGVTCDPYGHVIGLNLSYSMISGHIDSIFHLRHLQRLDLARNNFQLSPIPKGFEKLLNLTHLNLSHSCFSDQIPEGISRLKMLRSLDLSTIPFCELPPTFDDPDFNRIFEFEELHRLRLERPNLGTFFQNLNVLTEVYLDNVDLSAQGTNWSEALTLSLPNLHALSLSSCRLKGQIHPSFANLKSLVYINLEGNNLTSEVPIFLANLKDLRVLNLASCELYGNFPKNVFLLPNLKSIDISKNRLLNGEFPEFPLHNSLQFLSLYDTNFRGTLPGSIGNLKLLETLLLYSCNFTGPIPSNLCNLTRIVELDISNNNFTGTLPPFHRNGVPTLKDLRLSYNLLIGDINPSIFTLPSLQILYLNDNQFSGQLREFPDPSSSVLEKMYLHGNHLTGTIQSSVSRILSLVSLSLANNNFNGTVKMAMFQNLKNLTYLDLSANSLTIEHDEKISSFPQLEELKLSRCNLSDFPIFLKEQVSLRTLNLSDNKIQGHIPHWLWKNTLNELDLSLNSVDFLETFGNETFAALGKLVMRSCNLSSFPNFLKDLESLWFLDLSDNHINGRVPNWIWKTTLQYVNVSHNQLHSVDEFIQNNVSLPSLVTLDLRGNVLGGSLPRGICNLRNLSILDASGNKLTGFIPDCLGKMGTLSVLNLQRNSYQHIPADFGISAISLRSLNLNGNVLEGELPRSLANCTKLEVMDLGNNRLSDTFPFWLDKLPELKVVVLRNNRLYGEINVPPGRQFMLPNLGIVDLSSNNFTGELSQEFLQSLKNMAASIGENKTGSKIIGNYEYYQDSVTIMSKGTEMLLVRILTIFVSLDLSNNSFHGKIPDHIGDLKSLVVLNLSRNSFDEKIPESIAELAKLESLDLSRNQLSGMIPPQLIALTFLAVLDLSYNQLEGHIPLGNQFNTFLNDSYKGNIRLCGLPLSKKCKDSDKANIPEPPDGQGERSEKKSIIDWKFAIAGYACGIVIGLCLGYTFLPKMECLGLSDSKRRGRKQGRKSKQTPR